MSSTSEVGHAKNVANLQKLIEKVTTYSLYDPPVDNLKITSLQQLYTAASALLNEVEQKRNANKDAIYNRQVLFEDLKPTATKIINALDILDLKEGTMSQAKSINRVIQGGATKKAGMPEDGKDAPKTISTSRQSYTQQAENFGTLVQLLESIPNYQPNEEDLKLSKITTYQKSLKEATQKVDQTEAELDTKLIERDRIIYAEKSGLYDTVQNVKKYVKSAYGATSPEFDNVAEIKFTSYPK